MRLVRRLFASVLKFAVVSCVVLLAALAILLVATWHTALRADISGGGLRAVAVAHHGSLYLYSECEAPRPGDPQQAGGSTGAVVTADPDWSPFPDLPPPTARHAGFGLAGFTPVVPRTEEGVPRQGMAAVAPLWPLLLSLAFPPAGWLALRVSGSRGKRPVASTYRPPHRTARRLADALTITSALLLAKTAGLWLQTSRWHDYLLQWDGGPEPGTPTRAASYALRGDALQGGVAVSVDNREVYRRNNRGMLIWERSWWPPEARGHHPPEPHPFPWFAEEDLHTEPLYPDEGVGGWFGSPSRPSPLPVTGHEWLVPFWFLILLTAPLPVARGIFLLRRERRFADGLCPECGYDLRSSPDRCPECGREVQRRLRPNASTVERN